MGIISEDFAEMDDFGDLAALLEGQEGEDGEGRRGAKGAAGKRGASLSKYLNDIEQKVSSSRSKKHRSADMDMAYGDDATDAKPARKLKEPDWMNDDFDIGGGASLQPEPHRTRAARIEFFF